MEKTLAELFGLTFNNVPESIKDDLKDLKSNYLALVVNSLTKISKFFEEISKDKNLKSKLDSKLFLDNVKTQLQMSLAMTESALNNSMEMIVNMAKTISGSQISSKLEPIIEDTGMSFSVSLLSKRSYDEMSKGDKSKESDSRIKDEVRKKRKVVEGRQKKGKNDVVVNSQTFVTPRSRGIKKKPNATQGKVEQSQKTTTMTMVMNSQIDQTVPDSDTSSDEDDKMQVSTIKDTQRGSKSSSNPQFKKPQPIVNPAALLFSQIPQAIGDDSDSSDEEDGAGGKIMDSSHEGKKADSTPSFKIPKKLKKELEKKIEEEVKVDVNKFSLMSQLPQNDDVSSSEDDMEEIKPKKRVVKKKTRSTRRASRNEDMQENNNTSGNERLKVQHFKIVSPTSKIDTQYISALVVKNSDSLIVAGRWFGIWELEKTDDGKQYECSKRLVNQCKETPKLILFSPLRDHGHPNRLPGQAHLLLRID